MTTVEKLATGEELRAIVDPVERLRTAAEVTRQAEALADAHRTRRNEAALQLYYAGPRKRGSGAAVWRDTLKISRTVWQRVLDGNRDGRIAVGTFADPAQVAATEADIAAQYDAQHKDAKSVRNDTARYLMNSKGLSNAEVSRIAGFTTARATQLRTSY